MIQREEFKTICTCLTVALILLSVSTYFAGWLFIKFIAITFGGAIIIWSSICGFAKFYDWIYDKYIQK